MVEISEEEYHSLIKAANMLIALENAGVDNWDGYAIAITSLEE